ASEPTVHEGDGNLAELPSVALAVEEDLDLERVSFGRDSLEVEGLQDLAPVALEPGGPVAHLGADHQARQPIGAPAQREAGQRPVLDPTAGDVARPHDDVGHTGGAEEAVHF